MTAQTSNILSNPNTIDALSRPLLKSDVNSASTASKLDSTASTNSKISGSGDALSSSTHSSENNLDVATNQTITATNSNVTNPDSETLENTTTTTTKSNSNDSTQLTLPLLLTVISCTLGGSFQFGFAIGFVNNTAIYVQQWMSEVYPDSFLNVESFTFHWSIAVSIFGVGAFFGSFFGPMLSNHPKIGRRNAILLENIFFLSSSLLLGFVPTLTMSMGGGNTNGSTSTTFLSSPWLSLIFGRFLAGVGSGAATGCVPLYVAEIAPKDIRGFLGTIHQLLITIGIFLSQAITTAKFDLLGSSDLWRYTMMIPFFCSMVQIVTLPFSPESPPFLFKNTGDREKARESLKFFRRKGYDVEIEDELDAIQNELEEANGVTTTSPVTAVSKKPPTTSSTFSSISKSPLLLGTGPSTLSLLDIDANESHQTNKSSGSSEPTILDLCFKSKPSVQMPILIGIIVNLTMQLSGMDAVLYYSTQVFLNAGISLEDAEVCTTLVGFVNFLVTIPAMLLMDVSGRKTIQLTGLGGMFIGYNLMVISQCMAVWSEQYYQNDYKTYYEGSDSSFFGRIFESSMDGTMEWMDGNVFKNVYESEMYKGMMPNTSDATTSDSLLPSNPALIFYRYLAVFSMMWIVICFAFGPGCIAWFIIAELCPLQARATATSLGLGFNALANFLVAFFFPICLGLLGRFTFVIFIGFTALFWSLTNWLLVETKGKSGGEVEKYFREKYD